MRDSETLWIFRLKTIAGDKSNHIPAVHIPQLFYFYAFSTAFGWPVLLFSGVGKTAGPVGLVKEVVARMFGSTRSAYLSHKQDTLLTNYQAFCPQYSVDGSHCYLCALFHVSDS